MIYQSFYGINFIAVQLTQCEIRKGVKLFSVFQIRSHFLESEFGGSPLPRETNLNGQLST